MFHIGYIYIYVYVYSYQQAIENMNWYISRDIQIL